MRENYHSVERLLEDLSPLPEGDPVLAVIATADPRDIETATKGDIDGYEIQITGLEEHIQNDEDLRDQITDQGEVRRQIRQEYAERLQKVINFYYDHDSLPPAGLVEDTFMAEQMSEMPPELYGLSEINTWLLEYHEKGIDSHREEVQRRESSYELAKEIRDKRDRLGRTAKIATWICGLLLTTGITIGVAETMRDTGKESAPIDEIILYSGVATVMVPAGILSTGALAYKACGSSARRRATKKLTN